MGNKEAIIMIWITVVLVIITVGSVFIASSERQHLLDLAGPCCPFEDRATCIRNTIYDDLNDNCIHNNEITLPACLYREDCNLTVISNKDAHGG